MKEREKAERTGIMCTDGKEKAKNRGVKMIFLTPLVSEMAERVKWQFKDQAEADDGS